MLIVYEYCLNRFLCGCCLIFDPLGVNPCTSTPNTYIYSKYIKIYINIVTFSSCRFVSIVWYVWHLKPNHVQNCATFYFKLKKNQYLQVKICSLNNPLLLFLFDRSDTAILYNDRSVLESHHVSAAYRLLQDDDEMNILYNLSKDDWRSEIQI